MKTHQNKSFTVWLLLALNMVFTFAQAETIGADQERLEQPVLIQTTQARYPLGRHLAILEDPEGQWTFQDIQTEPRRRQFLANSGDTPNYGFTPSAYWVRFQIRCPLTVSQAMLLEVGYPHHDHLTLYVSQPDGTYTRKRGGDLMPFEQRELLHHFFIFNLDFAPGETKTVYLRIQTSGSVQIPLVLWRTNAFIEKVNNEQYGFGFYYGAMLVMALYNLFLFFAIRDRTYLYYVLYIVSYILFQMGLNGLAFEYLWSDFPRWANISLPFFIFLTGFFALVFFRKFLETPRHLPRLDKGLLGLMVVCAVGVGGSLIFSYGLMIRYVIVLIMFGPLLVILAGVLSLKKKVPTAKFYLLAWAVLIIGAMLAASEKSGLIPSVFITVYALQIGSALEVVLLSFGLADRINVMRKTTIQAQKEALRLKDEFLATLERKVMERTEQLQQKTLDINNILHNMHQGILTILEDGTIHPEYSSYLETILETADIIHKDAMELIFANSDLSENERDQIKTAIAAMVGTDDFMFEMNHHLLIKEFHKTMNDGHKKILEVDWDPIISPQGLTEKLMVTVRDITELRAAQQEAEKQKQELEIIGQILSVSHHQFRPFLETANAFLEESRLLLATTQKIDSSIVATLFRNMHTIKGNARTCGLTLIAEAAHQAEHRYTDLRENLAHSWDAERLLTELKKVRETVAMYETLYHEKLEAFADEARQTSIVESTILEQLNHLAQKSGGVAIEPRLIADAIGPLIPAIHTSSLEDILQGIQASLPNLAKHLGKAIPHIHLEDGGIRIRNTAVALLKDVFMHLFRNALDHGLEPAEKRAAQGKRPYGTLTITLSEGVAFLHLRFADDGQGLNLAKLREKAVAMGLANTPLEIAEEAAANLIFQPGVSTAQTVSDISGRGVGLDAVRQFLQKKGGTITLELKPGKDTGRPFEFHIRLPKTWGVKIGVV